MIFHVLSRADLMAAVTSGELRPDPLPFLHLCTEAQLPHVVRRYFPTEPELVALGVDEHERGEELRWERGVDPTTGLTSEDAELFPHLYAPLALSRVAAVYDVSPAGYLGPLPAPPPTAD